mgnify:CR=1 FL=1
MAQTIKGRTGEWEIVIGLEVHAQVTSTAKLFSGGSTTFGAAPNHNVALVDCALPGMLPVVNRECIAQAVRTGLGIKAKINLTSVFDRKNYFYPDLPQGYQISQLYHPIVGEGVISIDLEDGSSRNIGVERIHLEQDAGKSIHDQDPKRSFIDLNRTGVALMEIVSKPDLRGGDEASAYVEKLRNIMRYLGTCDGNMEQGSMRADVNVSVRPVGSTALGTRTETKNVNSLRFIRQAIEVEARRQVEILEAGGDIDQETRLFDPIKGEGRSMRSKEEAHDYRYFPCPDLLPVRLEQAFVDNIAASLPELPDEKRARFMEAYGLSQYDAGVLVADQTTGDYYEDVAKASDPKLAANWVMVELFGALNKAGLELQDSPVSAANLATLITLIKDSTISGRQAKEVFEIMVDTGEAPDKIVEERGMKQVSDEGALAGIIDDLISSNPKQVEQARENPKLVGWFVGQVMKATGGQANPGVVNKLLKQKLG